jgi:hypothetical protein
MYCLSEEKEEEEEAILKKKSPHLTLINQQLCLQVTNVLKEKGQAEHFVFPHPCSQDEHFIISYHI